ncbi:regulatory protein ArsR [Methanococcus vannielii SB]|uniref:Regulatory protein ArsR n=1 Tax=Methanococcus vannielii (strain ATCC 35089 / DSM 1224 / JCM 13029 / OCM 148 / SB) TaxID=406327 RepID=A6URK8_METVS|nr:metalloregulator ArsR/SmtB family transcription factor [Methanococcus vannielii]ABR55130.1 regulatory protein ArsR [Methanococcus vannielii SB]
MRKMCEEFCIHEENVHRVRDNLPKEDEIKEISNIMNSFGDPTRLKILLSLKEGELCSCDISEISKISISATSHQLRLLRDRKLVKYRKEGKFVYYELYDEKIKKFLEVILELNK